MKRLITFAAAVLSSLGLAAQQHTEKDLDAQYAADLLKPGTPAPDFTLKDIRGREVKLSDFRGRHVVLLFWASWCPDCRAEIPDLKALHAQSDPKKVAFVSVSFDRAFEDLRQFVDENYLPGVQLFDPAGKKESAIGAQFGVKWIPSLYLIDPDGTIKLGTVMLEKVSDALGAISAKPEKKAGRQLCTEDSCAL